MVISSPSYLQGISSFAVPSSFSFDVMESVLAEIFKNIRLDFCSTSKATLFKACKKSSHWAEIDPPLKLKKFYKH